MSIETSIIKRKDNKYIVEDLEGEVTSVDADLVDQIADRTGIDSNDVATVLSVIERSREIHGVDDTLYYQEEISDIDLRNGMIMLLYRYEADDLIGILDDMRYFEIVNVMERTNPFR